MANFDQDKLNRETNEFNNRNVNRFNSSSNRYGTPEYWRNYWNNQVYKEKNQRYSQHYM